MSNETGPSAAVLSVVESVKGKAKETAGAATLDESLRKEGRAEQDKASTERDVAEKEADAEVSRAEVSPHEAERRVHQR